MMTWSEHDAQHNHGRRAASREVALAITLFYLWSRWQQVTLKSKVSGAARVTPKLCMLGQGATQPPQSTTYVPVINRPQWRLELLVLVSSL